MRALLALLALLICGPALADDMPLIGVGNRTCKPFAYTGSPLYQSLTLSDSWTALQSALAFNQLQSPACTITGTTMIETAVTNVHGTQKGVSVAVAIGSHTFTLFAKRWTGTRNLSMNWNDSGFASGVGSTINLATCATQTPYGFGNYTLSSVTPSLVNGWCKVVIVFTTSATDTAGIPQIYETDAAFSLSYAGDGTSGIALWGVDFR